MSAIEILNMNSFSTTMPKLPKDLVQRSHLIEDIIDIFNDDIDVVIVESKEHSGKTVFMTQFAQWFYDESISIFINGNQTLSYDTNIIRYDVCSQIEWYLNRDQINNFDGVDEIYLKHRLYDLTRRLRRNGKRIFIVIDGMDQLVDINKSHIDLILGMLPVGYDQVKFLISSERGKLSNEIRKIFKSSKVHIQRLATPSLDEIKKYFSGVNIDEEKISDIYKSCKGNFGKISYIKRSLLQGTSTDNLLEHLQSTYKDLYDVEWNQVDTKNKETIDLLSLITFDLKLNKQEFYMKILNMSDIEIEQIISQLSFIEKNENNEICFFSDSFHKYVKEKLAKYEKDVYGKFIDDFMSKKGNIYDELSVSTYYEKSGRLKEFLNYLTPDLFIEIVNKSQSMHTINEKNEIALNAAVDENIDDQVMRFSMSKSLLKQMSQNKIWLSEIDARMRLDDEENAIKLVQTTNMTEDKLLMLSIIAKVKKEKGLTPRSDVLFEIKKLYKELNFQELTEASYLIASNLLYTYPDLAIDLIEKYAGQLSGEKKENALDVAYTTLSLTALHNENERQEDIEFTVSTEELSSKINNPRLKAFSMATNMILRNYSVDDLMIELEKLESNTDKLFYIGHWAKKNKETDNIETLLDYAVELLHRKGEYAPNAQIYLNIAYMLKNVTGISKKKQYISMFDSQKENIESLGPSEDYISLQLELAENEFLVNREESYKRLLEVYFYIFEKNFELETKLDCLSLLYSKLHVIDHNQDLEENEGLFSLILEEILKIVKLIIDFSSEHTYHLEKFIEEISKINIECVLDVILKVNTEQQRNKAYGLLANSLIHHNDIQPKEIRKIIDLIPNHNIVNNLLCDFLEELSDRIVSVTDFNLTIQSSYNEYMSLFDIVSRISEPELLCLAYCDLVKILSKVENASAIYIEQLKKEMIQVWSSIDISWRRVDVGYKIVSKLSEFSIDLAREVVANIEKLKVELVFDDSNSSWSYISSLRLSIKSLAGLMQKKLDTKADFEAVYRLIDIIPSEGEKARLYSEVAITLYLAGRSEEAKYVVRNNVINLIENISEKDLRYYYFLVMNTCVSLYIYHRPIAKNLINKLPTYERDISYLRICEFIYRKVSPQDPYEELYGQVYKLNYEEIVDLIEIIKELEMDVIIYDIIRTIVISISHRQNTSILTKQQRVLVLKDLKDICELKFPNSKFIKHDGYKIASLAYIWKCENGNMEEWKRLVESAKNIPNLADSALVISILIGRLPKKYFPKKDELEYFDSLVEKMPTMLDKIQLYESFSNILIDLDSSYSRKYIKVAMELTLYKDNNEIDTAQKRIINFAHRLDPEFANSLASLVDDDPARRKQKSRLMDHIDTLNLKKKIINERVETDFKLSDYSPEQFISASNKTLASLSAGRAETLGLDKIREYLVFASDFSFSQVYTTYSWIITNNVIRYYKSNMASEYLRPLLHACLNVSEISLRLATRNRKSLDNLLVYSPDGIDNNQSVLIKGGEKEKAMQYIEEWLITLKGSLIICDPYFGLDDLEVLKLINRCNPDLSVTILTSIKEHKNINKPWDEKYMEHWRIKISEQDPPVTSFYVVGTISEGKLPIHDRWWLGENDGLRFGSSFNSLGKNESEISRIEGSNHSEKVELVNGYIGKKVKEFQGDKIVYNMFDLQV